MGPLDRYCQFVNARHARSSTHARMHRIHHAVLRTCRRGDDDDESEEEDEEEGEEEDRAHGVVKVNATR